MSTIASELSPVMRALGDAARSRAESILAEAERNATAELAGARDEAERILRQAELDGAEAAARTAVMQISKARREARQAVLAAQRAAYETLRTRALGAVERRASTPEGRRLGEQLEALVRARVGDTEPADGARSGALLVAVERGNRRASVGPPDLVEQALQTLSREVSSLWA